MSVAAAVCSTQAAARARLRSSLQVRLRRRAPSFDQMMTHRIESSSAQQCMSQQRCAARRQVRALDRARRAGASRRVSSCACVPAGAQADATHRAAGLQALTARNAGGFGSRKAIDPLGMWPATERATQRRSAQHAGVGDVGTLAKAWGRGVHARLRGSLRRTGGRTRLQDTQPADRQPTSGCPSLLSLLLVPNLCMLTCLRVRARVRLCTCVYVPMRT